MLEMIAGRVPVEGGQLYYEVAGQGQPLTLIHAGVADLTMWDDQVAAFAPHYRVIRYDTRGFGRTTTTETSFSNRQDLLDLLNHLGVERTYLIGVSRGGQIAIDFTLEFPERVAALIPVAAGVGGYEHQSTPDTQFEVALFEEMEKAWEAGDIERLDDLEVQVWVDGPGQPEGRAPATVHEKMRRLIHANNSRQEAQPTARPLDPPAIGRLHEIRVPTLVILGDRDSSAIIKVADILAEGIAGAQKVVFPNTAHMLNLEEPERFNQVVLDFLASIPAPTMRGRREES